MEIVMKYVVYQIQTTRAMRDLLNQVGWAGLKEHEELAPMAVKMDLDFDGSENWEPAYFEHFCPVAHVEADSLDQVFAFTNDWENTPEGAVEILNVPGKMRSLSVGDLICCESEFFMVNGFGFAKVEV
jgi:hypothetical protein